jgi:hypothetical protein
MTLTPEQIAEGWLEHDGGGCPVSPETEVRLWFRDYRSLVRPASWAIWEHGSSLLERRDEVIAYRPEPTQ